LLGYGAWQLHFDIGAAQAGVTIVTALVVQRLGHARTGAPWWSGAKSALIPPCCSGSVGFGLTASRDGRTVLYSRVDSSVDEGVRVEDFKSRPGQPAQFVRPPQHHDDLSRHRGVLILVLDHQKTLAIAGDIVVGRRRSWLPARTAHAE